MRRLMLLLLALIVLSSAACVRSEEARAVSVLFINVGKADAILIEIDDAAYLIDTGTKESAPALLGALALREVEALDGVFLTHTHSDHIGGMDALAANLQVRALYSAAISENKKNGENKIVELGREHWLAHTLLNAGDSVEAAPGVSFAVLGPLVFNAEDDNDNSLILRLEVNGRRFLFAGDMQFAQENTLLSAGVDLRADILKVGNHGNPDATGNLFAQAVSPSLAVVTTDTTVDEDSANPRVLAALPGARVLITQDAEAGVLVTVSSDGEIQADALARPAQANPSIQAQPDPGAQTVTVYNRSDAQADLSGWMLYSERGNELYRFPRGATLAANASLVVACEGGVGDYIWSQKKVWHEKKEDACLVYDQYGRFVSRS